jgi:hypothetical protein
MGGDTPDSFVEKTRSVPGTECPPMIGKRELLLSKTAGSPSGDQRGECPARADKGDEKTMANGRFALPGPWDFDRGFD